MEARIPEILQARPVAVVGASVNRTKYGNIVFRNLRQRGWQVCAVNPRGGEIEGQPAHPTLADCPQRPRLVVMVTPPSVTRQVLEDAAALGVDYVWFQEGSFDDAVLRQSDQLGLECIHDACIMVMAARYAA